MYFYMPNAFLLRGLSLKFKQIPYDVDDHSPVLKIESNLSHGTNFDFDANPRAEMSVVQSNYDNFALHF